LEQIQLIAEKEMTSKLLKQFTVRIFIYSFLYFASIVGLFIFEPIIRSTLWPLLLITAINILFLMMLSKLATADAFDGINTTSAPKESLDRIAKVASVPTFIFTCVISFIDVIFLHSLFDTSGGYNFRVIAIFSGTVVLNIIIWTLVVNVYEKRILRKYLAVEEENVEKKVEA